MTQPCRLASLEPKYYVDASPAGLVDGIGEREFREAVEDAIAAWEGWFGAERGLAIPLSFTEVTASRAKLDNTYDEIVTFSFGTPPPGAAGGVAYACCDPGTGRLTPGTDIVMRSDFNWTVNRDPDRGTFYVPVAIAHEIGHIFGFGDHEIPSSADTIMDQITRREFLKSIGKDDRQGMQYLHGPNSVANVVPEAAESILLQLPFPRGTEYPCTQGPGHGYSHDDEFTRHDLDFATPHGSADPVLAAAAGTAYVHRATSPNSFGLHVNIHHRDDMFTVYAHLSDVVVSSGQKVQVGQIIGYEGKTGFATGDHIHFGLHCGNPRVDALLSKSVAINKLAFIDATKGPALEVAPAASLVCAFEKKNGVVTRIGNKYRSLNDMLPSPLEPPTELLPGWQIPMAADWGDWLDIGGSSEIPAHVRADFNGDGRVDSAWILIHRENDERGFFVVMGDQSKHGRIVLREVGSADGRPLRTGIDEKTPGAYLTWCGKRGDCNEGDVPSIQLTNPGIYYTIFGASASILWWDEGVKGFRKAATMD